jgi:hypothetical protein
MAKKKDTKTIDFSKSAPVHEAVSSDELMAQIEALAQKEREKILAREAQVPQESDKAGVLLDKIERERGSGDIAKPSRNREAVEFQGREFSERQMYERRFWRSHNLGKLWIDPEIIPADKIWFWAAKEIAGQDNLKGINHLLNKEWTFVRPADCPELCRSNELAAEIGISQSNFIVNDASILLQRDKWIHEIETSVLMRRNYEAEEAVVKTTNQMSDDKIANTFVAFNNYARSADGIV